MFVNELYVTLVLHLGRDAADRAGAWLSRSGKVATAVAEDEAVKRLEDAGRDLAQYLSRYGVRPLSLYGREGQWFSEPMELLRLVLTGRHERVPWCAGTWAMMLTGFLGLGTLLRHRRRSGAIGA